MCSPFCIAFLLIQHRRKNGSDYHCSNYNYNDHCCYFLIFLIVHIKHNLSPHHLSILQNNPVNHPGRFTFCQ